MDLEGPCQASGSSWKLQTLVTSQAQRAGCSCLVLCRLVSAPWVISHAVGIARHSAQSHGHHSKDGIGGNYR